MVGGGLGLVWGWFGGVVAEQWDGEIGVTIQAGLLSTGQLAAYKNEMLLGSVKQRFWPPRCGGVCRRPEPPNPFKTERKATPITLMIVPMVDNRSAPGQNHGHSGKSVFFPSDQF